MNDIAKTTAPQEIIDGDKVDRWAENITEAWDTGRESFFETGRRLNKAKEDCDHGEWMLLVGDKLPFGISTADKLMALAKNKRLLNSDNYPNLPNSWNACYDLGVLAKKKPEIFDAAVAEGLVKPDARYIDIKHWIKKQARDQRHHDIAEAGQTMPAGKEMFSLIYADPPWEFKTYSDKGKDLGPAQHYPELDDEGIANFKYGDRWIGDCVAKDALLFLWCTPANLLRALNILTTWGFEYRSQMVWVKDKQGTGFYARQMHEPLLIGVRGKPPMPIYVPPSVLAAPRGRHSEKPSIFRETLEKMYPYWGDQNRVELFARGAPVGWKAYGYEAH